MFRIEYDYGPVPTVQAFARSDAFIRGLMGPFGSGKSSGCVVEILRRALAQAPSPDGIRRTRFAVIRNSYQQLKDTSQRTVFQWLPPSRLGEFKTSEHLYRITRIPGCEIEILFRALDRPDQVDNLLSMELTAAWVNEAREVPWTIIQALQGRVGRYPAKVEGGASWYGLWMDTNPPDDDSWWYELFELKGGEGVQLFRQPSGRSPKAENLANLPAGYYEKLIASMDEDSIRVYVDGEYGAIKDGKPVYPEYRDQVHCREFEVVPGWRVLRGWDFGLTPACVWLQVAPSGQIRIFDELVGDSIGIDRFGDEVLRREAEHWRALKGGREDIGDPAGAQRAQTDERTCFELLQAKQIAIRGGEQGVELRTGAVKRALSTLIDGEPGLLIHPRCRRLRKGFQGRYRYRRLKVSAERYEERPEKNIYSHPHDALQYPVADVLGPVLRGKQIEEKTAENHPRRHAQRGPGGWMG